MIEIWIILACLFLVWLVLRLRRKWLPPQSTPADKLTLKGYQVCESLFVNEPERALFHALVRFRPKHKHVMSKVRLEDILSVRDDIEDGRTRWRYRLRIKSRHVDFALCDDQGRLLCAIELDGTAHNGEQAQMVDDFKDRIFQYAGLPLIRLRTDQDLNRAARAIWAKFR